MHISNYTVELVVIPKNWIVSAKNPDDIVKTLLELREIKDENLFFNPPNPFSFSNKDLKISEVELKKAFIRMKASLLKKEKIVIYGDYDVDGACATSILWSSLHSLGFNVFPFIPDRFEDGYGMTISGVNKIRESHPDVKLIITVDNGIVAAPAIRHLDEQKIDVIITDHHEKGETIHAKAIVHTTSICGSAIAWYFAKYLETKFQVKNGNRLEKDMDLVGIATICDQMKLVGINRALAFHGIKALQKTKRIGLLALAKECNVIISDAGVYEIGFVFGARINAAGRMSNALDVVRLLCTKSTEKATQIAKSLNSLNTSRQEVMEKVFISAREQINTKDKIIVIDGEFHEGVIGLAAGKLTEENHKPTVVVSRGGKIAKGSARSITGFNITTALREVSDLLLNVGGHEMAAGFSIELSNIDLFRKTLIEKSDKLLTHEILSKTTKIDCEIDLPRVDLNLATQLSKMEPFGNGNYKPTFLSTNLSVKEVKDLGKNSMHLKIMVESKGTTKEIIVFQKSRFKNIPKVSESIDVVYSIDINRWNGRISDQLIVKDLHISGKRKIKTREQLQ